MMSDYAKLIERLIREGTGEVILNGSHEHASTIISRMFANAKIKMRIVAQRFDPRIYGTPEVLEQSQLFLGDSDRSADILIDQDLREEMIKTHPFFVANAEPLRRGNLKVKVLNLDFDDWQSSFCVMDGHGYRFQQDKREAVATAAFGPTPFVDRLGKVFDTLWASSAGTVPPGRVKHAAAT